LTQDWDFWICPERDVESVRKSGFAEFQVVPTGYGEFTDRLKLILEAVRTPVFYMQEDFWLRSFPDIPKYSRLFREQDLDCLKVKGVLHWHTLNAPDATGLQTYQPISQYQFSHDAGFWKREQLLKMCQHHENPWANEINGMERIKQLGMKIRVAHCPNWYNAGVQKGVILDEGIDTLKGSL